MRPHEFLLDLDGTVLETRAGYVALDAVLASFVAAPRPLAALDTGGRTDRWIVEAAFDHHLGRRATAEDLGAVFAAYAAALDTVVASHPVRAVPGARNAITWLRRSGCGVRYATGNTKAAARTKLGACGLDDVLPRGTTGEEFRDRAALVANAITCAGDASAYFVVGDTVHDMSAAVRHGAFAIGVESGGIDEPTLRRAGADVVLPSIGALPRWYAERFGWCDLWTIRG